MTVRDDTFWKYEFMCTNKFRPQSNQRGELPRSKNFFKHFKMAEGYDGNMNQRTNDYRGLV